MNRNLRKEVTIPLIIIAAFIIALLAGVTTYRIVEDKDNYSCDCRVDFDAGIKSDKNNAPILEEEYIKDNDGYYAIIKQNDKLYLAPSNYDKDSHDLFKDQLKEINFSEKIEVSSYFSNSIVKEQELKQVIRIEDLKRSDLDTLLENGIVEGFIWLQDNNIIKILIFGEIIVYE